MGLTMPFACPVEGCSHTAYFRLGVGEELDRSAHAERIQTLRAEHPNHPAPAGESKYISVGEPFVLDGQDVGDCPAEYQGVGGMIAFCVLDDGHAGKHVATDGETVVEVWS